MIAEYAPGRTGTSSPPADLAEVVCADLDLFALEFDALMAANYPDFADRPGPRPPRPTARLLTRRLPPTRPSLPVREGAFAVRRRGTCLGPAARAARGHAAGRSNAQQEVMP
jgi:hypothetical protein